MFDFALFLLYLYEAAAVHVHDFFPVRDMGGRVAMPLVAALGPGGEKGRRPENRAFYVVKELPTFRGG